METEDIFYLVSVAFSLVTPRRVVTVMQLAAPEPLYPALNNGRKINTADGWHKAGKPSF